MGYKTWRQQSRRQERQDADALQKRDQILKRVPKHVTVFGIPIVEDPMFDEPAFVLVSNIRDRNSDGTDKLDGKPSGRGCAGGGLYENEYDTPKVGLIREIKEETGLTVDSSCVFNYTYEMGKVIYRNKIDGKKISEDVEYGGKLPRLRSGRRWQIDCLNPLFFYVAVPKWGGSPQQALFQRLYKSRLASGVPANDLRLNGLFYDFTYTEPDALGVTPEQLGMPIEGQEEIDGLALFPLSRIKYEFERSERRKGERGYPYYHHFHTFSYYGRLVLVWYAELKEFLLKEAEAAVEAAMGLPDEAQPLVDRISKAMDPSVETNLDVAELIDALASYCEVLRLRNPIDRMDFQKWFLDVRATYCKASGVPERLIDPDSVAVWYKEQRIAS